MRFVMMTTWVALLVDGLVRSRSCLKVLLLAKVNTIFQMS